MIQILTFNKINSMGLPVTFWVLDSFGYYNFNNSERLELRLSGYFSKKAYDDKMAQMDSLSLFIEGEEFKQYFSNEALIEAAKESKTIYCQIYNYIQEKIPELKDSTNSCILQNCTKCLPITTLK